MQFINDILSVLKSLSVVDFILYFAVLVLVILIVALIYIMKLDYNEEEQKEEISFIPEEPTKEISNDGIDLQQIMENINEKPEPIIDMTKYEEEQEEKAIISYDELIKAANTHPINYDEEELVDDAIMVKKINLEQITDTETKEEIPKLNVKLINYEREEAFLQVLKQMNELLN